MTIRGGGGKRRSAANLCCSRCKSQGLLGIEASVQTAAILLTTKRSRLSPTAEKKAGPRGGRRRCTPPNTKENAEDCTPDTRTKTRVEFVSRFFGGSRLVPSLSQISSILHHPLGSSGGYLLAGAISSNLSALPNSAGGGRQTTIAASTLPPSSYSPYRV